LAHLGIRLDAIHYGYDGEFKLISFGDARNTSIQPNTEQLMKLIASTPDSFKPPEFLTPSKCLVSKKIDIWALGIIFYSLLYFKHPFDSSLSKIADAKLCFPEDNVYSVGLSNLIRQMLALQPHARPSIEECLCAINKIIKESESVSIHIDTALSLAQRVKNFNSYMKERFSLLANDTIEGWVSNIIDCSELWYNKVYTKKLVFSAWKRPSGIISFYECLMKIQYINQNVMLKALNIFHLYLNLGPSYALFPPQDNELPYNWIKDKHAQWNKMEGTHDSSYSAILAYCEYLIARVEFMRKYLQYFDGFLSLAPFHSNPIKDIVSQEVLNDVVGCWSKLLFAGMAIISIKQKKPIKLGITSSICDESYKLCSIALHIYQSCIHYWLNFPPQVIESKYAKYASTTRNNVLDLYEKTYEYFSSLSQYQEAINIPKLPPIVDIKGFLSKPPTDTFTLMRYLSPDSMILSIGLPRPTAFTKSTQFNRPHPVDSMLVNTKPMEETKGKFNTGTKEIAPEKEREKEKDKEATPSCKKDTLAEEIDIGQLEKGVKFMQVSSKTSAETLIELDDIIPVDKKEVNLVDIIPKEPVKKTENITELFNVEYKMNGFNMIIDYSELEIEKSIGSGATADVFKGRFRGSDVAIKVLKTSNLNNNLIKEFSREVTVLSTMRNPNLVLFIGAW